MQAVDSGIVLLGMLGRAISVSHAQQHGPLFQKLFKRSRTPSSANFRAGDDGSDPYQDSKDLYEGPM